MRYQPYFRDYQEVYDQSQPRTESASMAAHAGVSPTMQWTQGQGHTFDPSTNQIQSNQLHEPNVNIENTVSNRDQQNISTQYEPAYPSWSDAQATTARSANTGAGRGA